MSFIACISFIRIIVNLSYTVTYTEFSNICTVKFAHYASHFCVSDSFLAASGVHVRSLMVLSLAIFVSHILQHKTQLMSINDARGL